MRKIACLAICFAAIPSISYSMTGEALYGLCKAEDTTSKIACGFYTLGIRDGILLNKAAELSHKNVCIPKKMTLDQTTQLTKNYLEKNPKSWQTTAAYSVMLMFYEHYPCTDD